ncbi:MAG TPA: sensor histidine kinase, partial [Kaistiaceae bacterium]|nr:sensor histidine kinase [Kaistiaceae bacterium]
ARENLFRAFEGSARPGGTGLGLAIAAELVHAHGGTIELADGAPGAAFVIVLPDHAPEAGDADRTGSV